MDLEEPVEDEEFQDADILDQLGLSSPRAPHEFETIPEESTGRDSVKVNPGTEILIMSVDLGDGRTGQITVHEHDVPETLAREFCRNNGLSADLVGPLTEQIEVNVGELTDRNSPGDEMDTWKQQLQHLIKTPTQVNRPTINERSKGLLKDHRDVFERLQPKPISKPEPVEVQSAVPSARRCPGFANPGEKLYFKGIKMKEDVRKHCQEIQKARGNEENKDLTFAPKLNDNSILLTKRSRSALKTRTPEDMLLVRGRISQEHKEKQRGEVMAQEHSLCTFVPCINPMSERIASHVHRSSSVNRFVELHEDAHRRKERQDLIADSYLQANYPFQPVLVSKPSSVATTNDHPLLQRLLDVHKDAEKYMEM